MVARGPSVGCGPLQYNLSVDQLQGFRIPGRLDASEENNKKKPLIDYIFHVFLSLTSDDLASESVALILTINFNRWIQHNSKQKMRLNKFQTAVEVIPWQPFQ